MRTGINTKWASGEEKYEEGAAKCLKHLLSHWTMAIKFSENENLNFIEIICN